MESLYDLAQYADNENPRKNAGFEEINLNRKTALEYCGIADERRSLLVSYLAENAPAVIDEILEFRSAKKNDPIAYARRILVFAILSAQVNFEENLYCMQRVIENLDSLTDAESIYPLLIAPYRGVGKMRKINGYKTKARYLALALPTLRGITPADMTHERISSLKGVGPKIAAFTTALWDDKAPVFTLDVWMLRLTAAVLGKPTRVKIALTDQAYALIEGDWLAWCHRECPAFSPFVVQWTLWNGCFGKHRSHLGILG